MSKSGHVSFIAPFVMERYCATKAQTMDILCKNLASGKYCVCLWVNLAVGHFVAYLSVCNVLVCCRHTLLCDCSRHTHMAD